MRILFMGSPGFASRSLGALAEAGHEVVGVVTRTDKPVGRGRRPAATPVKVLAESLGLPVFQPERVNAPDTVAELAALKPELVVVVAFGAILRKPLLTLAPRGAVNVHASLLPAYRGVAPVQWALIHGERMTGVTTMIMDEGVDTGPTLLRHPVDIMPHETAGELLERLARLGAELLVETVQGLGAGDLRAVAQSADGASYAPRLDRTHGYLDLSRTAVQVSDQFRGVTPAPGARVFLEDEPVLVGALRPVPEAGGAPYTVLEVTSRHLRVAVGKGAVDLLRVRPAGRGDMDGASFARGRRLEPGGVLSVPPQTPDLNPLVTVSQ